MLSRWLYASPLMVCLLTISSASSTAAADAASAKHGFLNRGDGASRIVTTVNQRGHGQRVFLPIAPSYLAYDYPYYYSRGYYPAHIGPGYIYAGFLSYRKISHDRRDGGR